MLKHTGYKIIFPTKKDKLHRMRVYIEMISKAKEVQDYFALGRYALRGKLEGFKAKERNVYDWMVD